MEEDEKGSEALKRWRGVLPEKNIGGNLKS